MGDECSIDVLRLEHDPPEDFGVCLCQNGKNMGGVYVFLRELFSSFHFSMVVWEIAMSFLEKNHKLPIFFDFWTQILLFVSSDVGIYGPARNFHSSRGSYDDSYWDQVPWPCRVYWVLFSAALPSTFLSCVIFWSQVYRKDVPAIQLVLATASPSVAFLEFVLVAFPLRLLNFFYFVIFYLAYVSFTIIYYEHGGTGVEDAGSIYEKLKWDQFGKAVLAAFVGLSIGMGIYFFFCFLSMIKLSFRNRFLSD